MIETTQEIIFTRQDMDEFYKWIDLDLESVTWQGRYQEYFDKFWHLFFVEGLSLSQLMERFDYALYEAKIGPLSSWFRWLREKLICFVFINQPVHIYDLKLQSKMEVSEISCVLRNFFTEIFPHLEEDFSEIFQISNVIDKNIYLTYESLKERFDLPDVHKGSIQDDLMPHMEVTLYPEWRDLISKMQKDLFYPGFNAEKIKAGANFKRHFKFLRETFLLILLGTALVWVIKEVNKYYEKVLAEKISVYEPQLKWLDRTLSFKSIPQTEDVKNIDLEADDIENIEENVKDQFPVMNEIERYDTESDVTLTSWDSLPKDFDIVNYEKSEYEELRAGGYRDSRYGNTKVYRVMMKSVDTHDSKDDLDSLMKTYDVTQVDNVRPGMVVPGGIYYNIYVPRPHLKEFLAQVMDVDEAILYESRTRSRRNPPGKNKVFIWVKSL